MRRSGSNRRAASSTACDGRAYVIRPHAMLQTILLDRVPVVRQLLRVRGSLRFSARASVGGGPYVVEAVPLAAEGGKLNRRKSVPQGADNQISRALES